MTDVTTPTSTFHPGRLLRLLPVLLLAAGCDRGLTDLADGPHPVELELYDRDTEARLAYVHGSGPAAHWHGSLPVVQPGEVLVVDAVFLDVDGHPIPLTDGREVDVEIAPNGPQGVVELALHGDHVHITAGSEGSTELVFAFVVDGERTWDTPPIGLEVQE